MRNSQMHQLALAGLLYGIDHFILTEKKNSAFPLKDPLFEKIKKFLSEKEHEYLNKLIIIMKDIPPFKLRTLSSEKTLSLSSHTFLDKLEERWTDMTADDVDNFFLDIKNNFSHMPCFPHCQMLSALLSCGEYPFICGGKIVEELKAIHGDFQGEILSGTIISRYIFNTVLPLFQARFYPIPLSCIIEINSSDFYSFLPGPVFHKGEKHLEEINNYLWEQRHGNFFLCWDSIEFFPEEIKKLPLLLFRLQEVIIQKSLTPFRKFLLDEGKHIFYINYKHGLCKGCKENPVSSQEKEICSICEKNIKLAEKSCKSLFLDLSSIIREEKYFPEIIQNYCEEELFTETEKTEFIPVFYPSLPDSEEDKKKFCEYCNEKQHDLSVCITRKTCSLTCMARMSRGYKKLSSAHLEFLTDSNNPLDCLYKNNVIRNTFSYLKSPAIVKDLCLECHNKDTCNNEIRCFYSFLLSSNILCITGAWDKVLNVIKIINSIETLHGHVILHSDRDNLSGITFGESREICGIEIFGQIIKVNHLKDLIDFTLLLSESIENGDIGKAFVTYLYECRELIENYFYEKDKGGLKFLPKITLAIKKHVYSEEIKEEMKALLEIDEEKSLLPYISFIIKYLNLTLNI